MNIKSRYVVLLGLGPAGLFLARQLKKEGICIYGICKPDDIGRYSNTLYKCYICTNAMELKKIISKISCSMQEKARAYVCSDGYLSMIIEQYPEIFKILDFSEPNEKILRLIEQKGKLMNFCQEIGVRFPTIYSIERGGIQFPVVIKPNIKHTTSSLPKITLLNSECELSCFLDKAMKNGLTSNDLLIQQAIHGDNDKEYGFGGYFRQGNPIASVYFIQARQYPQGVSCYTLEITDPVIKTKIDDIVYRFLKETRYSGFLQFDLKEDCFTKELFVLDINPRVWGSVGMLSKRFQHQSIFTGISVNNNQICWRFPLKELWSIRNKKNMSYSKCKNLRTKNSITVIDLFDKSDLKPFFMQPVIVLKKLFK